MIHLDGHDVLELGDRPIGAVGTRRAVVHRRLTPQPREVGPPGVLLVQARVGDVELVQRQAVDLAPGRRHGTHAWFLPENSASGNVQRPLTRVGNVGL